MKWTWVTKTIICMDQRTEANLVFFFFFSCSELDLLCFVSLSRCITTVHLRRRSQTNVKAFFFSIFCKRAEFIVPSNMPCCSGLWSSKDSPPPPPYLTVGLMFVFLKWSDRENTEWRETFSGLKKWPKSLCNLTNNQIQEFAEELKTTPKGKYNFHDSTIRERLCKNAIHLKMWSKPLVTKKNTKASLTKKHLDDPCNFSVNVL